MRWIAFVLLVGCGGPDKPALANAPRPDPAAVAGVAAAAAAAITLASPDTAGRRPEKNQDTEKAPIRVKENVPADVLDRLDKAKPATAPERPASDGTETKKSSAPPKPKDALDFSNP